MIVGGNISWLYVFFGIIAAGFVSVASFRLNMVEKRSELLYLSIGFYRHFVRLYLNNFFSAINLILKLAFTSQQIQPLVYVVKLSPSRNHFNPALLMTSFNMTTGLFCIGAKDKEIFVHAISESYFRKFDLIKTCASLNNANDDNLV